MAKKQPKPFVGKVAKDGNVRDFFVAAAAAAAARESAAAAAAAECSRLSLFGRTNNSPSSLSSSKQRTRDGSGINAKRDSTINNCAASAATTTTTTTIARKSAAAAADVDVEKRRRLEFGFVDLTNTPTKMAKGNNHDDDDGSDDEQSAKKQKFTTLRGERITKDHLSEQDPVSVPKDWDTPGLYHPVCISIWTQWLVFVRVIINMRTNAD
jgi:hypothetical protein